MKNIIPKYLNQVIVILYHDRELSKSMTSLRVEAYVLMKTQLSVWTKLNSVSVSKSNNMEPAQSTLGCGRLTPGGTL